MSAKESKGGKVSNSHRSERKRNRHRTSLRDRELRLARECDALDRLPEPTPQQTKRRRVAGVKHRKALRLLNGRDGAA